MFDGTVDGEVFGLNGNIDDSATFRDGLGSMTHCPGSKSFNFVTQNLDANQGKKVLIVYTCIYNFRRFYCTKTDEAFFQFYGLFAFFLFRFAFSLALYGSNTYDR